MLSRFIRIATVVALLAVAVQVTISLAQTPNTWTAGPGVTGTPNNLVLKVDTGSSNVGAPRSVTDNLGTTKTVTEFPSNTCCAPRRYLYFDDGSAAGSGTFARIDVEFYSDPALAGAKMIVEYDATGGSAFFNNQYYFVVGSGQYDTATFYLSDVVFQNNMNSGFADFRLLDLDGRGILVSKVTVTRSTTSLRPTAAASVTYDSAQNPASSGLYLKPTGAGITSITRDFGRTAIKVSTAGNAYFDVDDGYIFQGNTGEVEIAVTFYDKGFGFFYINYDALPSSATTFKDSFGPTTLYQANNIVYMQNTETWKTYKFNVSNIYFGNRLEAVADFKIFQPRGVDASNNYDLANGGYDLRIEKVVVTKATQPIDKLGEFEGNYAGFGPPAFVWTQLASLVERGHGLYQDEAAAATTAATVGGQSARRLTSGQAYFNVNDLYLKNGADRAGIPIASILIGVEYYDAGTGTFTIDYDSVTGTKSTDSVTRTNTNAWKRMPFYVTDGRFNNGLTGGNDFAIRITSGANDLAVRDVIVARTIGDNRTGAVPSGFRATQRVVGVHHFPVFDGYRPGLWEASTLAPAGTGADSYTNDIGGKNNVNTSYSFRSVPTHVKELTDMRDAGVDFTLVWFTGNLVDQNTQAVVSTKQMIAAAAQVNNAPKFGLLLDPVHVVSDPFVRNRGEKLNLNDPATQGLVIKVAEDYFALVPRANWATIEGRPIIALYYQGDDMVSRHDTGIIQKLIDRFQATHGVRPYVIADRLYDPDSRLTLPTDDYFSWGAALCGSNTVNACLATSPGYAQRSVFEIGPGFADHTGRADRTRDRQSGAWYSTSWDRAIAKNNHMVLVDTFNYFVEGSAISHTREFGRTYLDITATKAAAYKAVDLSSATQARVTLGATNTNAGVMQDDVPGQLAVSDTRGGRRAIGLQMWFGVADSFIHNTATEATIAVEYLDTGVNIIDVSYDGPSGVTIAGRINVRDSNTNQFKTATFPVNALFANRLLYANDLFLAADIAGAMVIRSVTVTRTQTTPQPTPTSTPPPCPTTAAGGTAVPTPRSGILRSFVPSVFRNACG